MSFWRADNESVGDGGFAGARGRMVDRQLVPRGIREPAVLEAMRAVPREEFMPESSRGLAYYDGAQPIGMGQTISQPYMVAVMTQHLLPPRMRGAEWQTGEQRRFASVLEVGCGSGYQAAVLARLADQVTTIERVPELAERAAETLSRLGYENVEVVEGDGTLGLPERGPFDGILVAAAAPAVPPALKEQLALGGRLVVPAGTRGLQELVIVHRAASGYHEERSTQCVFVPLIGEQGWKEG